MLTEIMDSGHIMLPPDIMSQLNWKTGDKLSISVENGVLQLKDIESSPQKEYFYIDDESETNPGLIALEKAAQALRGAAEEAGFKSEEEIQRYLKEVIRPQVRSEYDASRHA